MYDEVINLGVEVGLQPRNKVIGPLFMPVCMRAKLNLVFRSSPEGLALGDIDLLQNFNRLLSKRMLNKVKYNHESKKF
ncbi:MAG: hypothetical protein LBI41_03560 [Lactobacillales bacterium]|nr:hypothetical protein [Lactobacillales bacterium]